MPLEDVVEVSNCVAALTDVQFEAIYPFLDSNGRACRLVIPVIRCIERVLRELLFYLCLYFKWKPAR